jgi:LacI family transcriptional regulator
MEKEEESVTQRDIASALGLSQSAVSHALGGSPKVSEETRKTVLAYAKRHGYRMDPALSALAAYRTGKRKPGFQGTVGWVTNFREKEGWRLPPFTDYYEGARHFLETRGYGLDTVWIGAPGLSSPRITQILEARGIESLLLCPQETSGTTLRVDFSRFSVVTFGFSLQSPCYHLVTAHGFASMRRLCEELRAFRHRAIGFVYSTESEMRSLGSWIGGIHASHALDPKSRLIPPFCFSSGNPGALEKWLGKHRPDGIISTQAESLVLLEKFGMNIPDDLSFCLTVADPATGIGGMRFDNRRIGEIAARKLIGLHHARERGVAECQEVTAIAGTFWPGQTVIVRAG